MSSCPTKLELERLLRGDSAAAESDALDEHLVECAACRQTLSALAGGSEFWLIPNRSHETGGATSSQLQSAISRLKRWESSVNLDTPKEEVGAGVPLRFLGDYELL